MTELPREIHHSVTKLEYIHSARPTPCGSESQKDSQGRALALTPKSMRTKQRILQTAIHLIQKDGTLRFQMSDLAERCHMSKGALYYYFSNREEVIHHILNVELCEFIEAIRSAAEQALDPKDALWNICLCFAKNIAVSNILVATIASDMFKGQCKLMNEVRTNMATLEHILDKQIRAAKAQKISNCSVDTPLISNCICGMLLFVTVRMYQTNTNIKDPEKLARELYDVIAHGIQFTDSF